MLAVAIARNFFSAGLAFLRAFTTATFQVPKLESNTPFDHRVRMDVQRMIAWGGYDQTKPRVRLLLDALDRRHALADQIAIPVWNGVEDKSVAGIWRWLSAVIRLLLGWPIALWKLMRSDRSCDVLLPYPGTPDIFIVALLAKLQGRKLILDAFLPIHDTIVSDRAMVRSGGVISRSIRLYEKLGLHLADIILADTDQHAAFFAEEFGINRSNIVTVMVGAEPLFDPSAEKASVDDLIGRPDERPVVLFYGQLIPLHGLATILEATRDAASEGVHWVIVGKGQQESQLREFIASESNENITWIPWVDYERLPALIARADVCLGIFGASNKAARVIPNKMFQVLAMGKPIVTRSSPAVDDIARRFPTRILTVPEEDARSLVAAVVSALEGGNRLHPISSHGLEALAPDAGIKTLLERLEA